MRAFSPAKPGLIVKCSGGGEGGGIDWTVLALDIDEDAVATLTFSKRRIAQQVKKVLESAIANAENNHQLDVDRLVVSRAEVGRSVVMRRFHARGRGRSSRIEKWFSHLKIVVAERAQEPAEGAR